MIARTRSVIVVTLVLALAACGSDASPPSTTSTTAATSTPSSIETTAPVESAVAQPASTEPTEQTAAFPIASFAAIREDRMTTESAAEFQAALNELAERDDIASEGGLTATVMTAAGTWSGAAGKADGVRDLRVDDQFAIASITKSVVAAQLMLMVEAGELALDDLAADHLSPDLQFDTNGATIRDLLSHRSGLPDYYDLLFESQQTDLQRVWTPADVLELLPTWRTPPGSTFHYTETNYLLLDLVIERLRGRPLADVLLDGALAVDGLERLVLQPDESPTEPMAMPGGEPTAVLEMGGGYLPSLAAVTAFRGIASDSPSLALWWRAFCAGEIVSQASLTEMSSFPEGGVFDGAYGLGLFNPAHPYARAVGHQGELFGYMSWAGCLPEDGAVIVVLSNRLVKDGHFLEFGSGMASPLVDVLRSR